MHSFLFFGLFFGCFFGVFFFDDLHSNSRWGDVLCVPSKTGRDCGLDTYICTYFMKHNGSVYFFPFTLAFNSNIYIYILFLSCHFSAESNLFCDYNRMSLSKPTKRHPFLSISLAASYGKKNPQNQRISVIEKNSD